MFSFSREQPSTSGQKASHGHWEAIVLDIGAGKIDREETTRVCEVVKTVEKAGVEALKGIAGGNRGYSRPTNSAIASDTC